MGESHRVLRTVLTVVSPGKCLLLLFLSWGTSTLKQETKQYERVSLSPPHIPSFACLTGSEVCHVGARLCAGPGSTKEAGSAHLEEPRAELRGQVHTC